MPAPTVATTTSAAPTVQNTLTCTNPSGATTGDLIINFTGCRQASGTPTISSGTGWTELVNTNVSSDSCHGVYYKVLTGTGDTLTIDHTDSIYSGYISWRFAAGTFTGVPEVASTTGSGTTPDPPSLDPAGWGTELCIWIANMSKTDGRNSISAYPSGYSDNQENVRAHTNTAVSIGVCSKTAYAASDDPGTFTASFSSTSWGSATLALRGVPQAATGSAAGQLDSSVAGGTIKRGAAGSGAAQLDGTATGNMGYSVSGSLAAQEDATAVGSRFAYTGGSLVSQLDVTSIGAVWQWSGGGQLDATAIGEVFSGGTTWQGTGTAAAQLDGTATGIMQLAGAGSAAAQLDATAVGTAAHAGVGSAVSQLDGVAVGTYLQPLVGSLPSQLDGTADGMYVHGGAGAGAAQLDGTAVGVKDIKLAGSIASVLDGVAIGTTLQFMFGVLDAKIDAGATGEIITIHQAIGTLIAELDTTGLGGLFLPSVIYEPFEITAGTATEIGGTFVPLAITPDPATAALTATVDDVIVNKFGSIRIWLNVD